MTENRVFSTLKISGKLWTPTSQEEDCKEVERQKEDKGRRETVVIHFFVFFLSFVNISSIQQIK